MAKMPPDSMFWTNEVLSGQVQLYPSIICPAEAFGNFSTQQMMPWARLN